MCILEGLMFPSKKSLVTVLCTGCKICSQLSLHIGSVVVINIFFTKSIVPFYC